MSRRRTLVSNSLSIVTNQAVQQATSFILTAAIARILGPYELGQYTLAYNYYFIFMTVASNGLKILFTREIARTPEKIHLYLVSGTILQIILAILGYGLLAGLVSVLGYNPATTILCLIVGLSIIPFSISNITESSFQALDKMHVIALSTVPVYIIRVIVMVVAMQNQATINHIAIILVLSEVFVVIIEWLFVFRMFSPIPWRIDLNFMRDTLKAARTFIAIESIATFRTRIQVIILSLLAGETVVGLFGAATQLIRPFQIAAASIALAVFPSMSKSKNLTRDQQRNLAEKSITMLLMIALPTIVAFIFIGDDFLTFVYRDPEFAKGANALIIVGFVMVALSMTRPLSFLLVANGHERINLRVVTVSMVVTIILSIILILQFNLIGAAIASTLAEASVALLFTYFVYKLLFPLRLLRILGWPLLISAIMFIIFALLQQNHITILPTLIIAAAVYAFIAGGIIVQMLGGMQALRAIMLRSKAN